jgi:hypothetical protein
MDEERLMAVIDEVRSLIWIDSVGPSTVINAVRSNPWQE